MDQCELSKGSGTTDKPVARSFDWKGRANLGFFSIVSERPKETTLSTTKATELLGQGCDGAQ